MRKQILAVVVGVVALVLGGSFAWAAETTSVEVPFSFFVNNREMPAGTYEIRVEGDSQNYVMIQSGDRRETALALVRERLEQNAPELSRVVFDKTADGKTFLAQVYIPGEDGFVLWLGKGEATPVTVAHKG